MASKRAKNRLRFLIAFGCLASIAVMAYRSYWLARPVGEGPAGREIAVDSFRSPWTDRPVLLLGVGDSITAGLGARRTDHSYFNRLAKNPPDEFPSMDGLCLSAVLPNLQTKNLAISGTTSLTHLSVLAERLEQQEPDLLGLIVMTTGGNDLIHNYGRSPPREGAMYGASLEEAQPWIANFQIRLNEMLDIVDSRFPGGCLVFLADIYDPTDGVGDAPSVYLPDWPDALAIHGAYNRVIHSCAEKRDNVYLVRLHEEFLGHGSHCRQFWRKSYHPEDPHYWYYDNIEDPNDRGYDAIRRLFLDTIAEAAEEIAAPPVKSPGT
jgi:lysophospholipase L1-like esterase